MFTSHKLWLGFGTLATLIMLVCVLIFLQMQFSSESLQWQLDQPGMGTAFHNLLTLLGFTLLLLLVNGCGSFIITIMATSHSQAAPHRVAEHRHYRGSEAYRLLASLSPQSVWACRPNGQFTFCNQRWIDFTGLTMEQSEGEGWAQAIDPDFRDENLRIWGKAMGKGVEFETEILFRRASDGLYRWHLLKGAPLKDEAGRVTMWIGIAIDIHELRQVNELEEYRRQLEESNMHLESLATTDSLTKVHNRHAFQEKLNQEVKRNNRYSTPLSLLLLDVDHFKDYNDTYGHPAGDEALRDMGKVLENATRTTDFVARYGGEEFAILMPGTDQKGAIASAEKIRRAVEEGPWGKRPITVSIGVATLDQKPGNAEAMIEEADVALYLSKKDGRNCVHVAADGDLANQYHKGNQP